MQGLLSPAIAVMNRLSYGKKNLLLSILSLLAVLVVIASLYQSLNRVIQRSQLELEGLRHLNATAQLLNELQKYRGLSMAVAGGMRSMQDRQSEAEGEVDRAFMVLTRVLPAGMQQRFGYPGMRENWQRIKQSRDGADIEGIFADHGRLVDSVLQLQANLADQTKLLIDNEPDTRQLIRLLSEELPDVLEKICQLRGRSIAAMAQKNLTDDQRMAMLFAKNNIELHMAKIENILAKTVQYNPALKGPLSAIRDSLHNAVHLFTQVALPDILRGEFSHDSEYFVSSALFVVDTNYRQILENLFPAADKLLQARVENAYDVLRLSIGIPMLLFGALAYLAIGAHVSVSGGMAALVRSTTAFARGDLDQSLRIASRDELGQMADSFNQMAAGFALLLKSQQQNEKRLISIVNSALDAVVQMDAAGLICGWNRQAEIVFGWRADEATGAELHTLIIPERFREAHGKGLKQYLSSGNAKLVNQRIEIVGLHRQGHEFPIELTITPNQLHDGIEFSAFIRDISSQKQALKTLQDSELRYRMLFESSRDAIITLCPARGILSGNPAAISLFACRDEAELIRQDPVSLSPPFQPDGSPSAEAAASKIQRVMAEGFNEFEWVHRRLNGETFIAEVQLSPIAIGRGTIWQATVRDITERKQAKTELLASESRFRGILRTMADAVVQIDAFGHILLVNDATLELFGYHEEELMGNNIKLLMPEPHGSRHDEYLKRHRETRGRVIIGRRVEFEAKHKNGDLIPIELSVNELMDDEGHTYIGVIQDIRKRKAAELTQESARREAEHLAHVKSEFLANMSHEIRTPLNAIIGLAKIALRDRTGSAAEQANSRRMYDAGMHLLNVVNDILDFSKIEAGKMIVETQPFNLALIIEDALGLIELRAKEKHLQLVVEKSKHLPEWVVGDAFRVRQILVNLLSNAVKFTEHGYVSLSVRQERRQTLITVSDSGIGISAEQRQRLFAAFEQADGSTTRRFGGSGLGLAISRNLARIMGGDIFVRSQPGVGSQFCLSIPLPATHPRAEEPVARVKNGPRLSGLRILAADDVELNRLVLEDLLVYEGADVVFAENGRQALERLEEIGYTQIDAVLMDIQMPIMDGYQATRKILEFAPDLPVIGLTAHAMPEERQRCLAAGMRERVTKPIDNDHLVKVILQHLPVKPRDRLNEAPVIEQAGPENPQPETAQTGLIDWAAVRQRFDGRQDFILRLIDSALDGSQQANAQKLRQASHDEDFAGVKFVAHALKGFAGVFQAAALMELAQAAEKAAKAQEPQGLELSLKLADCLELLLTELQHYREIGAGDES